MIGTWAKDGGQESVGEVGEEARWNPVSRWMGAERQGQEFRRVKEWALFTFSRTQCLKSGGISKIKAVIICAVSRACSFSRYEVGECCGCISTELGWHDWTHRWVCLICKKPPVCGSLLCIYASVCLNDILNVWQDMRRCRKHSLVYPTQPFCFDIWGMLPAHGISISY